MYSYGLPHMAEQKQDNQLEHTYSSSVRIWGVALKTCQRRWTIGRSGERGSGISMLVAWDDDDFWKKCCWLIKWVTMQKANLWLAGTKNCLDSLGIPLVGSFRHQAINSVFSSFRQRRLVLLGQGDAVILFHQAWLGHENITFIKILLQLRINIKGINRTIILKKKNNSWLKKSI